MSCLNLYFTALKIRWVKIVYLGGIDQIAKRFNGKLFCIIFSFTFHLQLYSFLESRLTLG